MVPSFLGGIMNTRSTRRAKKSVFFSFSFKKHALGTRQTPLFSTPDVHTASTCMAQRHSGGWTARDDAARKVDASCASRLGFRVGYRPLMRMRESVYK